MLTKTNDGLPERRAAELNEIEHLLEELKAFAIKHLSELHDAPLDGIDDDEPIGTQAPIFEWPAFDKIDERAVEKNWYSLMQDALGIEDILSGEMPMPENETRESLERRLADRTKKIAEIDRVMLARKAHMKAEAAKPETDKPETNEPENLVQCVLFAEVDEFIRSQGLKEGSFHVTVESPVTVESNGD